MSILVVLTLLCPDTAYFQEPFPVQIQYSEPYPPGGSSPTAWEARSGLAGIVGQGTIAVGAGSFEARIDGPGAYFGDSAVADFQIGKYDPMAGQIKAIPGPACKTVMRIRPTVGIRARVGLLGGFVGKSVRVDGRRFK